jgi:hypothetical protein
MVGQYLLQLLICDTVFYCWLHLHCQWMWHLTSILDTSSQYSRCLNKKETYKLIQKHALDPLTHYENWWISSHLCDDSYFNSYKISLDEGEIEKHASHILYLLHIFHKSCSFGDFWIIWMIFLYSTRTMVFWSHPKIRLSLFFTYLCTFPP